MKKYIHNFRQDFLTRKSNTFFLKIDLINSSTKKEGISINFVLSMMPVEFLFMVLSSMKSNESFFFFAVNEVSKALSESLLHLFSGMA